MRRIICSDTSCKGFVNEKKTVGVRKGACGVSMIGTHPCRSCGLLHLSDGTALINSGNKTYLLKDGITVVIRSPEGKEVDISSSVSVC